MDNKNNDPNNNTVTTQSTIPDQTQENNQKLEQNTSEAYLQSLLAKASLIDQDALLQSSSYCDFFLENQWNIAYIHRRTDDNKFELLFNFKDEMKTITISKGNKLSPLRLHSTLYKHITCRDSSTPYTINDLREIKELLTKCDFNPIDSFNTPYDIIQFYTGRIPEILDGLQCIHSSKNDDISMTAMEILLLIIKITSNVLSYALKHKESFIQVQRNKMLMLIDKHFAYLLTIEVLCQSLNRLISAEYKQGIYVKIGQSYSVICKNIGMEGNESSISNITEDRKMFCLMIDYFHKNQGIENIFELILQCNTLPFDCIDRMISAMKMYKMFINYKPFDDYYNKLVSYYIRRINGLNENELKELRKNSIIEYSKNILAIGNTKGLLMNQNETIYYYFLYKCLLSQNLEKRIYVMNSISSIIGNICNANGNGNGNDKKDNDDDAIPFKSFELLSEFIKEKNIFNVLLGENAHDELIKRSISLFRLFAMKDLLPDEIYELLWKGYTERHETISLQIENVICEMATVLNEARLQFLFSKLKSYPSINVKILWFIQKFTHGCFRESSSLIQLKPDDTFLTCNRLYGLPLLWKYMQDDYESCAPNEEDESNSHMTMTIPNNLRNIKECIAAINSLLMISTVSDAVVMKVLSLCMENILQHKSIIQSLKLIKKICAQKHQQTRLFNDFGKAYDIIGIVIKDLERYMSSTSDCIVNLDCDYEGFYSHEKNIQMRLKLIFFLVKINNFNCFMLTRDYLLSLWSIFTLESGTRSIDEKDLFYNLVQRNIESFNHETLQFFFNDILNNPARFLHASITRNAWFLYEYVFIDINKASSSLYDDKKNLRVKSCSIEGIDTLWKIVLTNPNEIVQEKASSFLCDLCLHLYDYSSDFTGVYWKNFIGKLSQCYTDAHNENNSTGINGLISLTKKIYNEVGNEGLIPSQEDVEFAKHNVEYFIFQCPFKNNKQYKIKVSRDENLFTVRWRLAYYYDIEINRVIFKQKNRNASMIHDFTKFMRIFDHRDIVQVTKSDLPIPLSLQENPRRLIEDNEAIFKILFNLLHHSNEKYIANAWELIQCLPENNIIQRQLKSLGESNTDTNSKVDLGDLIDLNSLYVMTYSLQLINKFIVSNEWLMNFIINEGHIMIMKVFLSLNLSSASQYNSNIIYDCLNKVVPILKETIGNINMSANDKEVLCAKVMELIEANVKVSIANDSKGSLCEKEVKCIEKVERDFLEDESKGEEDDSDEDDDDENEGSINRWKIQASVIRNLITFVQGSSSIKRDFEEFFFGLKEALLANRKRFEKLYSIDYITLVNPFIKKELYMFISKICEEEAYNNTTTTTTNGAMINDNDSSYTMSIKAIFFETIFTMETLSFAKQSDHTGFYFNMLSSLLSKYIDISSIHIDLKQLCDFNFILTIHNDTQIEGYMKLLLSLLNKAPSLLKYIVDTYDVCDILLRKCILSKCQNEPLTKPSPNCTTQRAQLSVYMVIVALCSYSPQLTEKVIGILNDYHHLGFWKTKHIINWRISLSYDRKAQYVGLKNLGATCYMNSFLQQLFMIPQLRDTLLTIPLSSLPSGSHIDNGGEDIEMHNDDKYTNCLYHLQNIFAGLKAYESQYYNPKDLCLNFDGEILDIREQKDAEEFYSKLIDKAENRIKDSDSNRNLFKYFFGGKIADEVIFKGCIHKRENELYYNSIQLQVAGKKNLIESLDSYVQGEMMEGNNAILCEKCERKIPALKRQTFKAFPRKLIFVLKRFEFDYDNMVKYKLNNYFEFPMVLNMGPYAQVVSDSEIDYDLTGFIIHSGCSEYGHYYSIIKEEVVNGNGEEGKWYRFNDMTVREFDIDNIENEAFGGFEDEIDNDGKKKTVEKSTNAYVLIYTKRNGNGIGGSDCNMMDVDKNEEMFPSKIVPLNEISRLSNIPNDIMDKINNDMFQYWILKNISSIQYQRFIKELLKQASFFNDPSSPTNLQWRNNTINRPYDQFLNPSLNTRSILQISNLNLKHNPINIPNAESKSPSHESNLFIFGSLFYFNVILRSKESFHLAEYTDIIKSYINQDITNAQWLIEEFCNPSTLKEFLIDCPISQCKKLTVGMIYCALLRISLNLNDECKELIECFTKAVLQISMTQSDMDFIWMVLYRIVSVYKDLVKPLLDMIDFDGFGWEYYCVSKKATMTKISLLASEENGGQGKKYEHHLLSDRSSMKIEHLTSFEETVEKKAAEKLCSYRNDRYLLNIMTMHMIESDFTIERIMDLLFNLRSKSSAKILSNTLLSYTANNPPKSRMIIDSLITYIKSNDYGMLDYPLIVCRLFLFSKQTPSASSSSTSNPLGIFFNLLHTTIKESLTFFLFIETMTEFIIKCQTYHRERLQIAKTDLTQISSLLYSFFEQNKYPPKYYPSQKVTMYKEDNYVCPKVSQEIRKTFEENYDVKRKEYQQQLIKVYRSKCDYLYCLGEKIERDSEYDEDEDLTDFRFAYGDKVKNDGYNCKVIGVLDEIIQIEYDKEEIQGTKKPKFEWIETDARYLVISELVTSTTSPTITNSNVK